MKIIYFLALLSFQISLAQEITLSHNIGNNIRDQIQNFSCGVGGNDWARIFVLEDFGITGDFDITSVNIGIESTIAIPGPTISARIYQIDDNFPDSFSEAILLGSSELKVISYTSNTISTIEFVTPIHVSSDVERILVEIHQEFDGKVLFIGGTELTYDYSWYKIDTTACTNNPGVYLSNYDLNRLDLNYYITATGMHTLSNESFSEENIALYPNPAKNILVIEASSRFEPQNVSVLNISGQEVLNLKFKSELDISTLASGLYILKITGSKGTSFKKFIKD